MARTQVFTDINAFGDAVLQLADVDAAGAAMLSRMLATERATPSPGIAVMATVADDQRIRVAVMRASGLPLIVIGDVGGDQPEARTALMRDLVNGLLQESQPVDRFRGPVKAAESLARTWSSVTGAPAPRVMTLLLYRLGTLLEPRGVIGSARPAAADDQADAQLIAAWWYEFARETAIGTRGGGPDPQALAEDTRHGRGHHPQRRQQAGRGGRSLAGGDGRGQDRAGVHTPRAPTLRLRRGGDGGRGAFGAALRCHRDHPVRRCRLPGVQHALPGVGIRRGGRIRRVRGESDASPALS